ncbi:hypothetical protein N0V93_004764 [Gnomoniopsis smithogilvyi]|uniref:Rhodopsin domain-containing protein n=1 Tax=Gnomoniopsis smithogilvyi TaxID=1191159 RepID=A0A9W8YTG0_9PEZI|nr:hypothetical protein N0V93_004764 [Gnomoniopsis smithogilvyi]
MAVNYTPLPIPSEVASRLVGNSILIFITVLVVALRFVARLVTGSKLGWDDYLILAALPQVIGLLICQGLWSVTGVGYPFVDVPVTNFPYISLLFVPFEIIYNSGVVTAKLSVLFFYLRVFTHGSMRRAARWVMVLVGVWGVGNLCQSFLVCRVHDGHVDLIIDHCQENTASLVSTAIFNCLTNLIIGLLPLYTIWSLVTVSVSTRMGLTCVFVLGISVTLVSVYRIYLLASNSIHEPMISIGLVTYLSVLEVTLSILCNSLPMLLPLYSYWRYRKVYAADQDEYVSRIRNDGQAADNPHKFIIEGVANGLPLETIYGKANVHHTTVIGTGVNRSHLKSKPSISKSIAGSIRGRGTHDPFEGDSATESTRRLPGITIETKWTVTEETRGNPYRKI